MALLTEATDYTSSNIHLKDVYLCSFLENCRRCFCRCVRKGFAGVTFARMVVFDSLLGTPGV
jgi:hypothetical protein